MEKLEPSNPIYKEKTMRVAQKPSVWSIIDELNNRKHLLTTLGIASGVTLAADALPAYAQKAPAESKKPNILVIFGDDIGWCNISAYNMGIRLLFPDKCITC